MAINENNIIDINDAEFTENTPMVLINQDGKQLAIPVQDPSVFNTTAINGNWLDITEAELLPHTPVIAMQKNGRTYVLPVVGVGSTPCLWYIGYHSNVTTSSGSISGEFTLYFISLTYEVYKMEVDGTYKTTINNVKEGYIYNDVMLLITLDNRAVLYQLPELEVIWYLDDTVISTSGGYCLTDTGDLYSYGRPNDIYDSVLRVNDRLNKKIKTFALNVERSYVVTDDDTLYEMYSTLPFKFSDGFDASGVKCIDGGYRLDKNGTLRYFDSGRPNQGDIITSTKFTLMSSSITSSYDTNDLNITGIAVDEDGLLYCLKKDVVAYNSSNLDVPPDMFPIKDVRMYKKHSAFVLSNDGSLYYSRTDGIRFVFQKVDIPPIEFFVKNANGTLYMVDSRGYARSPRFKAIENTLLGFSLFGYVEYTKFRGEACGDYTLFNGLPTINSVPKGWYPKL